MVENYFSMLRSKLIDLHKFKLVEHLNGSCTTVEIKA